MGRSYAIDGSGDRDTVLSIEIVQGSASVDRLVGNAGQNELHGNGGQDLIYGAHGDDVIYGGADRDIIYGDLKSETVSDGNDTLYGEDGNDVILGLGGDDVLVGGAGVDTLWGGSDADRFVLDVTGSVDLLRDFDLSEGDTLDISDILNGFYTGAEDIADYIQITDNGTHSTVFIDQNGGGDSYSSVGVIYNVTGITDVAQLELNGDLVTL